MTLSVVSLVAIAAILAALYVSWSRRFLATGALVVANLFVFVLSLVGPETRFVGANGVVRSIPTIHAELALLPSNLTEAPALGLLQLLTSMFVHADFWHIFGNLLILLAFALPFEERIGHRRFLFLYIVSGFAGALVQVAVDWGTPPVLMMGASGAVFGVIGAFAATYPNLIVPLPLPLFVIMLFVRMRVWVAACLFAGLQLLYLASPLSRLSNTAYFAHLGGLAAGIGLGIVLARHAPAHRKPVAVDLKLLSPFAHDTGTTAALDQMKANQDEPQIFQAWLDRFFRTATCPTCKHKVMPRHHGEVVCTQGHRFDVRKDQKRAIPA